MLRKTYLVLSALLLLTGYFLVRQPAYSQESGSCGTITISGASGTTTQPNPVSGIAIINVAIPNVTTQPVSKIIIRANGQEIGRSQPNSSNFSWQMPWVTNLHADGSFSVDAVINYANTTGTCLTPGVPINILNGTKYGLTATANPNIWQGPMSFSFPVSVQANVPLLPDATQYSIFQWSTSIGNINSNFNQAQFSSGQTVGSGNIIIQVKYGGKSAIVNIPVNVSAPDTPLPAPATTTATNSPATAADATSTTPEAIARVAALQNNPVIQNCTISALGEARFTAINKGEARPTLEEIKKFTACFASSNYILPSNFSPVAPNAVKDLPKAPTLQINKPENVIKTEDTGKTIGLRFAGKSSPNSVVLLYIFSEPLVLTTTADKDGNWTYTLEDPIESGQHEVYTVVDRGNGVYERSDPVSFFLGTASAAEGNPSGLSLSLSEQPTPSQSNRSMVVYAASAVAVVTLVLAAMFLLIRRRGRKLADVSIESENSSIESTLAEGIIAPTSTLGSFQPESKISEDHPDNSQNRTDESDHETEHTEASTNDFEDEHDDQQPKA